MGVKVEAVAAAARWGRVRIWNEHGNGKGERSCQVLARREPPFETQMVLTFRADFWETRRGVRGGEEGRGRGGEEFVYLKRDDEREREGYERFCRVVLTSRGSRGHRVPSCHDTFASACARGLVPHPTWSSYKAGPLPGRRRGPGRCASVQLLASKLL
ncbi:hypothetical protein B296_00008259 [Ensete ventricosum]|uniref:Uncharacterized protein n=1 Tax=Ensete ventricosum TaxID=4639 RepID=A0A426YUY7_ENSVE|nr:hypothetical protein B296_00008259 [Ensete ventricosum]